MIFYSFLASFLFAVSIPITKLLLKGLTELTLSAILYLSSFAFLFLVKLLTKNQESDLTRKDFPYILLSILFGGFLGPILMIFSLKYLNASSVSLFTNFEMIFTVMISILFLGESKDIKFFLGFFLVVGGVLFLNLDFDSFSIKLNRGVLFILASTFCWALDNNFTSKISSKDPVSIAMFKGFGGGVLSLFISYFTATLKSAPIYYFVGAVVCGILSYALSLVLIIYSVREMGVSRTFTIFNSYPVFAFILSMLLFSEPFTLRVIFSFLLVTFGMFLVILSKHNHLHSHILEHEHLHSHNDLHHNHKHDEIESSISHSHKHVHNITHSHPHYNDIHHLHH
jgi:drug/metabolite transporter (DMT)-like permease